ncbi:MAG: hypothetical protein ACI8XX_002186 [Polaribacter sp.]|jgi:hypothetical protein
MSNRRFKPLLAIISTTLLLLTSLLVEGIATEQSEASSFGNVVTPQPQKPTDALSCVEPVEVMRRDHMEFLLHQRDQTVKEGIRSPKYSLTGCIDCHAQPVEGAEVVRIDNPNHFCAGCHQYTSVKIDCFECHADRPASSFTQSSFDLDNHTVLARLIPSRLDSSRFKTMLDTRLNKPQHEQLQQVKSSED